MNTWSRTWVAGLTALVAGCTSPASLDVGPATGHEDDDGKADGASSGKTELKVTIDSTHIPRARSRVGLLNADSQTRHIWFYDTPTLSLYEAGVILRGREIDGEGEEDDSTVKFRPMEIDDLSAQFKAHDDMKCEIDRDPDSAASACSLKIDVDEGAIAGVGAGDHQPRTLFDSDQEAFYAAYGPAAITWYDVDPLGPVNARVWEIEGDELPKKLTAELWYMPGGGQVLELSMKVNDADANAGMQALLDFADARDLSLSSEQVSKTERALRALAPPAAP